MKICNKCNIEKDNSDFYKKKGKCKQCISVYNKNYIRSEEGKKAKKLSDKKYYKLNKDAMYLKYRDNKNQYRRQYYKKNKLLIFEKEKQRYKNDVQFRLSKIYRNRMNSYIKGENNKMDYLHCNLSEFREFIEIQFTNDMSWDNQGTIWELDHVIPVSKFNLEIQEHKNTCFHWCNYKPIPKSDNKKKSNKIIDNMIKEHNNFNIKFIENKDLHYINIYEFLTKII